MDGRKETSCCFVIASCNGPILFKLAEEILDQVSGLLELPVIYKDALFISCV
jgi:hypothetical protein